MNETTASPAPEVLRMATLTAARRNPVIAEDFKRLTDAGKPHKVAMTACMRKLLVILNTMLKNNTPWNAQLLTVD